MRNCEDFTPLLDPYVDGELSAEEAAGVRQHLSECPDCRAYVQAALAIRDAFPEIGSVEVPPDFAESVMSAVRAQKRTNRNWFRAMPALAACFALAAILWLFPMRMGGAPSGGQSAGITMARNGDPKLTGDNLEGAAQDELETGGSSDGAAYNGENGNAAGIAPQLATSPDVYGEDPSPAELPEPGSSLLSEPPPEAPMSALEVDEAPPADTGKDLPTAYLTWEEAGPLLDDGYGNFTGGVPYDDGQGVTGTVYEMSFADFSAVLEALQRPVPEETGDLCRIIVLD